MANPLQFIFVEVINVIDAKRVGRPAVIVVGMGVLVAAAASAAAIHWKQTAPVNTCLMCDTPEMGARSTSSSDAEVTGTGGGYRSSGGVGATVAREGAMPQGTAAFSNGQAFGSARSNGSRGSWQPWGNSPGSFRGYSANGQAPSSSLGGLWRLMNMAYRRGGDGLGSGRPAAFAAAKPKKSPGASKPPAGPRPPGPAKPVGQVAATDPFHEHEVSAADPFLPPAPGGPLDPGGHGGGLAPGSDLAATPEPGSMLMIGTGLAAIVGALRRRRLV